MYRFVPSGPQRHPWKGHWTQSPTTLPPWPMWAPRCLQCAFQNMQLTGLVTVSDQVLAEVPKWTDLADRELG